MAESKNNDCFIIMPIADVEGYPQGHFKHVYENIIIPSCEYAGYNPVRADEVKAANLIHLDILKKLLDAPISICDLSSRNPNVLFELGVRQAFDKPVVLIQEMGTPRIFDIAPLRYLEYSRDMKYHDVLRVQNELKEAIEATIKADGEVGNVNSIVKLLALNSAAKIPELKGGKEGLALEVMHAELRELRKLIEVGALDRGRLPRRGAITVFEFERISNSFEKIMATKNVSESFREEQLSSLLREAEDISMRCEEKSDHMHFRHLMDRIHQAINNIL